MMAIRALSFFKTINIHMKALRWSVMINNILAMMKGKKIKMVKK